MYKRLYILPSEKRFTNIQLQIKQNAIDLTSPNSKMLLKNIILLVGGVFVASVSGQDSKSESITLGNGLAPSMQPSKSHKRLHAREFFPVVNFGASGPPSTRWAPGLSLHSSLSKFLKLTKHSEQARWSPASNPGIFSRSEFWSIRSSNQLAAWFVSFLSLPQSPNTD